MNNNEHLPVYGPGPVIGGVMVIITIAACFMRNLPGLETGRLEGSIGVLFITAGIFLIAAGIALWITESYIFRDHDRLYGSAADST